ncbi:MAG: sugar transferase, partial [Kineosporiaceae bacterium]
TRWRRTAAGAHRSRRARTVRDGRPGTVRPRLSRAPRPAYRADLRWQRSMVRAAVVVDVLAVVLPVVVLVLVNAFNSQNRAYSLQLAVLLPVVWPAMMYLSGAHDSRFLGLGSEEFKRVFDAAIRVAALVATVSYALHANLSRGIVVVALPAATVLDLLGRYGLRKWIHRRRRMGGYEHRVLIVGNILAVSELSRTLRRASFAGMEFVGCCLDVPYDSIPGQDIDVRVLGGTDDVVEVIVRERVTAVAVTSSASLDSSYVRRLAWRLEGTNVDILVAPGLTDCVGPRIHVRPVAGLPLLHIEQPELSGAHRLLKAAFDLMASLAALLLLSPLLLGIGLVVRLTTPGPALFRQVRIGRGGHEFTLYKFRTMHADAESDLEQLAALNECDDGLLFKIRSDPRVTRIGGILRRYSLDELPQLLNVLRGDMSLVGPRPPLPSEVDRYQSDVRRRLLVPPGLTGLWQISGRSDLSWEESVRLDLFYVENWSLALDLMILWKTVPAVFRHSGAY